MKQYVSKSFIYLLYIILIGYIIVAIFFPQKSTDIFGFRTFVVISDSMEPKINVYDMVVIKKADKVDIDEGDIITFDVYIPEIEREAYVTHYVKEITTNTSGETIYKTHGEGNIDSVDDWRDEDDNIIDITYEDVEGIYLFKIPGIGRFIYMLRDPIFIGLLILNGAVIYFVYKSIKKIINTPDKKKKD